MTDTVAQASPDTSAPAAPAALTFEQAITSARALRPLLISEQGATEERSRYSEDLHNRFIANGYYHLLRPKKYGGYEFSVTEFLKVMREIGRGCMSTGWGLCLASGHNLQAGAWFGEQAQEELFAGTYFASAAKSAPGGTLTPVEGGFILNSTERYASGSPYSTHFLGRGIIAGTEKTSAPVLAAFVAPMSSGVLLDDWGTTLGLRGSGSNSLRFEDVFLPAHYVARPRPLDGLDQTQDNPGAAIHDNPLYCAHAAGFFSLEIATVTLGGILGAFDEYEQTLTSRKTLWPPAIPRTLDPDYQRWYADALVRLRAAEAILDHAADLLSEYTSREHDGGAPFTTAEDLIIAQLAREGQKQAWKVFEDTILKTAGSSAVITGTRTERAWRDASTAWGHINTIMTDMMGRELTNKTHNPTP
jgi:3-hydroxy-9,10-secoandrosta-1,3,5(10)-triene-9,17-dione monooxygenase